MQIKSLFSYFSPLASQVSNLKKASVDPLTLRADELAKSSTAADKKLAIEANLELGRRFVELSQMTNLHMPIQTVNFYRQQAATRYAKAVELGIGLGIRSTTHVQLLLNSMPDDQQFVQINHLYIPKCDLECWARGEFPVEEHALRSSNARYEEMQSAWQDIVRNGAANVHIPGLLANGAGVLATLRNRNNRTLPDVKSTEQSILKTMAEHYGIAKTLSNEDKNDLADAIRQYELAKSGLGFALSQNSRITENGLDTDVHEVIQQMWWYCMSYASPTIRAHLIESFIKKLQDIANEHCCNTGCVQRLLQTVEAIDPTITPPNEGALLDSAQTLTARLIEHIDTTLQNSHTAHQLQQMQSDMAFQGRLLFDKVQHITSCLYQNLSRQHGHPPSLVQKIINKVVQDVETNELMLINKTLADLNGHYTDVHGDSVLIRAAKTNNLELLAQALAANPTNINQKTRGGFTALHVACSNGLTQVIEKLLNTPGINPNVQSTTGDTALHLACLLGNERAVDLLLASRGILVNATNKKGITPFVNAVNQGHHGIADKLFYGLGLTPGDRQSMIVYRAAISVLQSMN